MHRLLRLPASLIALSYAALSSAQDSITLTVAANAAQATKISQAIDPSFAGFGIEPSNLFSFTGGSSTNELTVNLLQNLADYSGRPPHIRLGGNTQDYMIYDASYNEYALYTNPNAKGQGTYPSDSLIFGPNYFKAADRLPQGTPLTFGLNLAYTNSDYISRIVTSARAAVDGFSNVDLVSFEIGNEPDLYLKNGFRTGAWGGTVYVQQWLERAEAVYTQVLGPARLRRDFFEPAVTASTIGTTFEIDQLLDDGITKEPNYVSAWNQHNYFYFIGVTGFPLTLSYLLDLRNTEAQFAYWAKQVTRGLASGFPYHLREMASVGPVGMQGVSDTFGGALWTLNFFLYAASLDISTVQMHMTDNSLAAAWQPGTIDGKGPHVRPSYSAYAAMAQLIGSGNGTTRIAPLSVSPARFADAGNVRAYAAYVHDAISAVVVINSRPGNASDTAKPSLSVTFSLGSDSNGQTLHLSRLTGPGADSTAGTVWNGMSFETSGNGTATEVEGVLDETVTIDSKGRATISLQDSSAVVANLGSRLGANVVIVEGTIGSGAAAGTQKKNVAVRGIEESTTTALIGMMVAVFGGLQLAS